MREQQVQRPCGGHVMEEQPESWLVDRGRVSGCAGGDAEPIRPCGPMREGMNFILGVVRSWWRVLVRAGIGAGKK